MRWSPLLALLLCCAPLPGRAQNPLRLGGEAQSQVRIANDPLQPIRDDQQLLLRRQQDLAWREAEAWAAEAGQVRNRRLELEQQRAALLLTAPPSAEARRWSPGDDDGPDDEPPGDEGPGDEPPGDEPPGDEPPGDEGDGGQPDPGAGPQDAGASEVGSADASPADQGASGGGRRPDAAPPTGRGLRDRSVVLEVVATPDGFLPPGTHPEELAAIDEATQALRAQERTLASLQRLHNEQASQITAALTQADALLQAAEQRAEDKPETYSLRQVEQIALQLHLARIEEALARARQRSLLSTDAEASDPVAVPFAGRNLSPARAYAESLQRAEALRELARQVNDRVSRLAPRARILRRTADEVRTLRDSLDLQHAQRTLADRERTLAEALDRLKVTEEDQAWASKRLERSHQLRVETVAQIEEELDTLRTAAAHAANQGGGDDDIFADGRVRAMRMMFLKEQLSFEGLKLQRDQLWVDLIAHLPTIMEGRYPPQAFLDTYRTTFDPRRVKERQVDLETRCDGWRRANNTVKQRQAPPGKEFNKELLIEVYAGLTDLCMREEWVFGTESRLGQIAQHHLQRLEWSSRSLWWYAWRLIVSLLLVLLIATASQTLRRLTRRLAGSSEAPPVIEGVLVKRTPAQELRARILRLRGTAALLLYVSVVSFAWLWGVLLGGQHIWGMALEWSHLLGWATHSIFLIGDNPVSIWSLVQVILWFTAGLWLSGAIQNFVTLGLLEHFSVERGIRDAIGAIIRYLVVAVALAVGLASVGIGLGALGILFGVIGIGIGFGLQNIASNFISGFILLFERPIRRGDFIQVGELVGEVKDISARATTLETRDGITVIVPNSEFVSGRVVNWTLGQSERVRAQVKVGVAYGTDVAKVEQILLDQARQHPEVLNRPAPRVQFTAFGDSSLNFVLHVWSRQIRGLPSIISDLNKAVDAAFRANGIEIPFPQRTVHHVYPKGQPPPGTAPPGTAPPGTAPPAAAPLSQRPASQAPEPEAPEPTP